MGEIGDTMVLGMQGGGGGISSSIVERETRRRGVGGGERTLLEFLRERMDDAIRVERSRRRTFKERLGFICCGPHWSLGPFVLDDDDEHPPQQQQQHVPLLITLAPTETTSVGHLCSGESPATAEGMNLAAALAVERQLRAADDDGVSPSPLGPEITSGPNIGPAQNRMSLMRLLHETECEDLEKEEEGREKVVGGDVVCCVCMGRKKGAAFIPCGHTFCRVCSRELWLNRGSCPLCNRPILEILDIF